MNIDTLLHPGIKSVLVKGLPGTGKTSLVLELLKVAGGGMYVSTRSSKSKMSEQFPYLKNLFEEGSILEYQADVPKLGFEDLRLGTATDLIGRVLDAAHKSMMPLIVLDSWDALAKRLDETERLRAEQSLVAMVEATDSKLIFVGEYPELTTTDYLVDAVITLRDDEYNGRRLRIAEWNKVRAVEIPRKRQLFTLSGGRFRIFEDLVSTPPAASRHKKFKPTLHNPNYYSTGSEDLDILMGKGVSPGSSVLIELGKTVNRGWFLPFASSIRCNFLVQGSYSVDMPIGTNPDEVKRAISKYVGKTIAESRMRICHFENLPEDPSFVRLDGSSIKKVYEGFSAEVQKFKTAEERPCFMFVSIDFLYYAYGKDDVLWFVLESIRRVRQQKDAIVFRIRAGNEITQQLSDLCDIHLAIDGVEDTPILYSVKPSSQLMHLCIDHFKGYPMIRLTPIV